MMMPSRGLQAIRANAPKFYQQQCRNVSLQVASTLTTRLTRLPALIANSPPSLDFSNTSHLHILFAVEDTNIWRYLLPLSHPSCIHSPYTWPCLSSSSSTTPGTSH
jgi:hypothetical protein